MSETLKDLLEYLQNKIDSGEHKIFYNDLGWDIKTIDCINAINEQQEEIERLNNIIKEVREYVENNKQYAELENYGKNGEYYIDEIGLLEILDKGSDSNVKD